MATLKPAAFDPPNGPARTASYNPKPPPPTPATGPVAVPLELAPISLSNYAATSLPNIHESTVATSNDQITTHVLNQTTGNPAAGLRASLTSVAKEGQTPAADTRLFAYFTGMTDSNGRILDWYTDGQAMSAVLDKHACEGPGVKKVWKLKLESEDYWQILGKETFLPEVEIKFYVDAGADGGARGHWHIPVLLGQWGFTTYRGS